MSNMNSSFPPEILNLMAQLQKSPQFTAANPSISTTGGGQNNGTASFIGGLINPQAAPVLGSSDNAIGGIAKSLLSGANEQAGSQIAAAFAGK